MGISALTARVSKLEQIVQSKIPPEPWQVFFPNSEEQYAAMKSEHGDSNVIYCVTVCCRRDCDACTMVGSYSCRHKEQLDDK